jgi:aminoglycoside phosphotransferase (APT) family kinase protein
MIPEEKIAPVTRGLLEAFGVTEFDDIQQITKGRTNALVFRVVVRGTPFLLRIIMRSNDSTCGCHFACMRAAAEAGLAPRVWYASVEDRLSITDFVETVPFPAPDAVVEMPRALRALHALPKFPAREPRLNTTCTFLLNTETAREKLIQPFQAANILSQIEFDELLARYAQLAAAYPHDDSDMVSSHNDLFKPDNILFDGQQVWLVDWEAAFLNDRYADLAVMANLLVTNDAEERIFLQEYFGREPNEYQWARFFLAQQFAHMFYTMAFLFLGSLSGPIDWSETIPEFSEFSRRMWAGEVELTDSRTKTMYGRVHWQRLQRNMRQPRFDEALRIVAGKRSAIPGVNL